VDTDEEQEEEEEEEAEEEEQQGEESVEVARVSGTLETTPRVPRLQPSAKSVSLCIGALYMFVDLNVRVQLLAQTVVAQKAKQHAETSVSFVAEYYDNDDDGDDDNEWERVLFGGDTTTATVSASLYPEETSPNDSGASETSVEAILQRLQRLQAALDDLPMDSPAKSSPAPDLEGRIYPSVAVWVPELTVPSALQVGLVCLFVVTLVNFRLQLPGAA
jgi:hypothetical protein